MYKIWRWLDNIAYPKTSHGIWRSVPYRGEHIPRSEDECDIGNQDVG